MNNTKYILKKVGDGILLGIGIAIVMVIFGLITSKLFSSSIDETQLSSYKEYTPDVKLSIAQESFIKINDSSAKIIGVVQNDSKIKWSSIQIEVELRDKNDNLIDEFNGHISRTLEPEAHENFKVALEYPEGEKIPSHDHYIIRIVSAYSNNYTM